jgi:hypothetical protein
MTSLSHSFDLRSLPGCRFALGLAVVGLIPGFGYLAIFVCGILGALDSVRLAAERLPAWFAPMAIAGLIFSAMVGLSSGTNGDRRFGLRACAWLAVLLMVVDVPLMLVQLASLFAYYD